ncbi:hypothetical protein [Nocardia asteroides]|uniref:Mce family protein n=1 Tax=Nocardia asteroides NBRC 15531 TaxID=1110697 RepID=U5EF83_NOCAS|nr:hypothetical protein [Nocardia asteroides]TLF62909.1 hypothetical protein FEK33_28410 [Nocardia asteroides NBRC 15531]UGT46580.1 hypothetical protein LT345_18675 [Nocardia asteroides]SFN52207.1 Mce-associated membrane protein [Nocardia asteroides]VEG34586.1 Uncharacterised protein [Nocardia asteroides]GAD85063.1 hypothetical protein NCAST_26_00410 [Nocardia asteroides NBRC 15531]
MSRSAVLGGLLGSLALAGVLGAPNAAAFSPEQARVAACDFAREVSTYDYAHDLDGYFQRVVDRTSGTLRAEFTGARAALITAMRDAEVTSTAEAVTCGVIGGDMLNAEIMVNLTQARTTGGVGSRQHVAITMRLNNDWGRWLVNEMDSPML